MFRPDMLRAAATTLNVAPWKLALVGAGALAATVSLAIVAAGVFLLVLPVALLVVGAARWLRPPSRPVTAGSTPPVPRRDPTRVIDVEFEVIDNGRRR